MEKKQREWPVIEESGRKGREKKGLDSISRTRLQKKKAMQRKKRLA